MDIKNLFTFDEKKQYLEKLGYTVQLKEYTYTISVYHNDTDEVTKEIWHPEKDGELIKNPYHNGKEDWVDYVFVREIKKKFKEFLLKL